MTLPTPQPLHGAVRDNLALEQERRQFRDAYRAMEAHCRWVSQILGRQTQRNNTPRPATHAISHE